jgi:nucleotide-binding universal stress UspA family protein
VLSGDPGGPVVVAVGIRGNGQAVDWAAAEAAARGCPLHVVHAERLRWTVDPSGLVPVADVSSCRLAAEDILRVAVRRARAVAPDVEVSGEAMFGSTVPLVLAQGRRAQLLVVGSPTGRFARGPRGLRAFPVSHAIVRRAECPVAIVRPLQSGPHAEPPPRVVVGVAGSGACAAVLDVAFRAAAQRGLPVTAVHAWIRDAPDDHEVVCGPSRAAEKRASRTVDRALEPWRCRFGDVPVETLLVHGDPASALVRESEGAALLVVGDRMHGPARGAFSASVSRGVAQRARCPVVVVRDARTRAVTTWRGRRDKPRRAASTPCDDPTGTDAVRGWRATWE